jgi:hypothetical protein
MPILNYSTEIPASRSVGEIIGLLARKGAQSITQEFYGDGRCKAIAFLMNVAAVPVSFRLPVNIEGVFAVMAKDKPHSTRSQYSRNEWELRKRAEAERVSWRILKDWMEAQMALIESGQADPAQIFLPYAQQGDGRTMYELFLESKQKQLSASTE